MVEATTSRARERDAPSRRRLRIFRRRLGALALPWLAPPTVRLLSHTWRLERAGVQHLETARRAPAAILVLWHGNMLLPMQEFAGSRTVVLVSPSDDGELAHTLLSRFGYRTLRGSSNESPARALRGLVGVLASGSSVAITPDGPRGPRHSVNAGPAWLARETGAPLLGVGAVCDRSWSLPSWDRFTIPKPRARVAIAYTEPLAVARGADDVELARVTAELRGGLLGVEAAARRRLGLPPESGGSA